MKSLLLSMSVLLASQASFAAKEFACVDQKTQQEVFVASESKGSLRVSFLRAIRLNNWAKAPIFTAQAKDQMELTFDSKRGLFVQDGDDAVEVTMKFDNKGTVEILAQIDSSEPGYGFTSLPRSYDCR